MSDSDRPEPLAGDDAVFDAKPACTALVPIARAASRSPAFGPSLTRPNSTFVAHLIATAEHAPQTRQLRRATPAAARDAYTAIRTIPLPYPHARQVIQA
jgi:hypothetical protein